MNLPAAARRFNRNVRTHRRHRIEVFLQIVLPLLLGIVLIGALMYFLFTASAGDIASAAQLATVLLALPLILLGIVFLVFAVFMIILVSRVMDWIPSQTYRVQRIAGDASAGIVRVANLAITPLIVIESWVGAASRLLRGEDGHGH